MSKKENHYLAELMMDVIPKAMQSIRLEMRKGRGERLSVPQFRILAAVQRGLGSNKEICGFLGVSEAAISRMVEHLVNEGLIKKGVNKDDRRHSLLSLTAEGSRFFHSIRLEARVHLKEKMDSLSSEEVEIVINAFEILQNRVHF